MLCCDDEYTGTAFSGEPFLFYIRKSGWGAAEKYWCISADLSLTSVQNGVYYLHI